MFVYIIGANLIIHYIVFGSLPANPCATQRNTQSQVESITNGIFGMPPVQQTAQYCTPTIFGVVLRCAGIFPIEFVILDHPQGMRICTGEWHK